MDDTLPTAAVTEGEEATILEVAPVVEVEASVPPVVGVWSAEVSEGSEGSEGKCPTCGRDASPERVVVAEPEVGKCGCGRDLTGERV